MGKSEKYLFLLKPNINDNIHIKFSFSIARFSGSSLPATAENGDLEMVVIEMLASIRIEADAT